MNNKDICQRNLVEEFCRNIANNKLLVQGSGGNVSWKENDKLWIKASGKRMSHAGKENIFVGITNKSLKKKIENNDFTIDSSILSQNKLRPSIEIFLHALIKYRVVVHLHEVETLAFLVRKNSRQEINTIMKRKKNWCFLNYYMPGEILALQIYKKICKAPNLSIFFLKNHGVIIGANNIVEIESKLKNLCKLFVSKTINLRSERKNKTSAINLKYFEPISNPHLNNLVLNRNLFHHLKNNWGLFPDHVVFLDRQATIIPKTSKINLDSEEYSKIPFIFFEQDRIYQNKNISCNCLDQLECYYNVIIRQENGSNLSKLSKKQIQALLNWDLEKYRLSLSK